MSRGFALIEVLVAMLVLAFGLIGLAALQATGIKNVQTSYNRSQAIHLAQDMADRIRANKAGRETYADVDKNGQADIGQSTLPSGVKITNCSNVSGCSKHDLAQNDVYQWKLAINAALPSKGCGSIARGNGTKTEVSNGCGGKIPADMIGSSNNTYIISINWDENGDGQIDKEDPNFVMSFDL